MISPKNQAGRQPVAQPPSTANFKGTQQQIIDIDNSNDVIYVTSQRPLQTVEVR